MFFPMMQYNLETLNGGFKSRQINRQETTGFTENHVNAGNNVTMFKTQSQFCFMCLL